jgi:DNA-binding MarR family transcriptional regulator
MQVQASTRYERPGVEALSLLEEVFWRALMRIVFSLPRRLDRDLVSTVGMTTTEYRTLMCLSEAPKRELRMTDLANSAGLSVSRMTRLVDDLQSRGWVARRTSSQDGRGHIAKLTPAGMTKLKTAWAAHLVSVRGRVFDPMDPAAMKKAGQALSQIAALLEERP